MPSITQLPKKISAKEPHDGADAPAHERLRGVLA